MAHLRTCFGLFIALLAPSAWAFDGVTLQLQSFVGEGWRASDIRAELTWQTINRMALTLHVGQMHLADGTHLQKIKLTCREGHFSATQIQCKQGQAKAYHAKLQQTLQFQTTFQYQLDTHDLDIKVRNLALAGGRLFFAFKQRQQQWFLSLHGKQLAVSTLAELAQKFGLTAPLADLAGTIDVDAELQGAAHGLNTLQADIHLQNVAATDDSGEVFALEGATGTFTVKTRAAALDGAFAAQLLLTQGELTHVWEDNTFYWAFSEKTPARIQVKGRDQGVPQVTWMQASFDGVRDLTSVFDWSAQDNTLNSAHIQVHDLSLKAIPSIWLDRFDDYNVSGLVSVDFRMTPNGKHSTVVSMQHVSVENTAADAGITDLQGRVVWHNRENPVISRLSWHSGHLKQVNIGASDIVFSTKHQELKLEKPARIPILDGHLQVHRLHFSGVGETDWNIDFAGDLEPISLERFSVAMGWPKLNGKLAGSIPGVKHVGQRYLVDGELIFRVFDGQFVLKNLELDDILGIYPIIRADVEVGLDLRLLTETFDFGEITGRLEGYIRNFVMENGVVAEFDAKFATPENDESEHKMSQRAVDNIANLGGSGIAGALSRSFLRFFDTFSYDRLGVSCQLRNGVCKMGGVEDTDNGYYIVKGAGIPRIDIKGFNNAVDWRTFIEELNLAMHSTAQMEK